MSALTYDPFMREIIEGDPYPIYEQLRRDSPRLYLERYNAWVFSTFEDVWALSKQRELSVAGGITPSQLLLGRPANRFMVSQMDAPEHPFYRTLLNTLFKPAAAAAMEARVREHARALAQRLAANGGGDLVMDYAAPLAVTVGCVLSGLPENDVPQLLRWTNQFFHRHEGRPGDTEVGAAAGAAMIDYIAERLAAAKRGAPSHGAMQILVEAQRQDDSISDDHILYIVLNLQIGAGDTVPKGICSTFYRLWRNPDQWAQLRADPNLALAAFLEGVRIDMPTQMQGRTATEALPFDGIHIEPGQKTLFLFASANRDPQEFPQPGHFDIQRNNKRTLGFGNGNHRCLGVHIAQMEGRHAIEQFAAALPAFDIDLAASHQHNTEYVKGWSHLIAEF